MSNYQGPATLIAGDSKIEVEATLSSGPSGALSQWGGSVQTREAAEDFYTAMKDVDVSLLLPGGEECPVVATPTAIGSGRLRISGSGTIPF
ncbi:DUF4873 domain-containing protein [Streptomyces sp. H27-C3]|uniref:DUF4873 domain-containing protein n=1 Tax=Streptomyces sp. H27-C3 TaxID=3046305 RepID=UPI0024B95016|nr:DUF4873 domain-containing protein [Streptomyces sp. H27-C3]MDJ0462315.1 DUF4873 domain-containing protein [Streptomyces sp. H27-C3]